MKIYRNGELLHDLTIDERTTILRRLMVENSLNLRVAVARSSALGLKVGDYTTVDSERYVIMDEPSDTLRAGIYDHTIIMRGALHRLEVYVMPDEGRDEWWYFGSPIDHINRVMAALHTKEAGWTVQLPELSNIPDISPKNINYANMSILSAFHAICSIESGWGLEFDVLPGQIIRFDREIKNPTMHTFEYGLGKGLYEMTCGTLSGERMATRIIGYGGTANILNGARLSFASINGGLPYIDKNVNLYGLREERVNFDHIYPRRNASITSDAVQIEAGKANWAVIDATLDFNLTEQLLEGAVIKFNTGECVGVEFEIVNYDHSTKMIAFKEYVDEGGGLNGTNYVLPNMDRKPKAGDSYVLVNIVMPESYTTAAQHELKAATEEYAAKKSVPQRSYNVVCDPRVFRKWNYSPTPGDGVRIVDAPNGVDYSTRIIGVEYPVISPDKVKLTLSDKVPIPNSVIMARSIKEVKSKMAMLDKNQITEERLRAIFHPLGGRENLDIAAKDITASGNITAKKLTSSEVQTPNWQTGPLGGGLHLYEDANGCGVGIFDKLEVRQEARFNVLTIQELRSVGGAIIVSPANAILSNVTNGGTYFKCFYKPKSGAQMWKAGDQARCQRFAANGLKYYWRLVTDVSTTANQQGEHWVNLSVSTADGNGVPTVDDEIVLLGHRGADNSRKNAIVISSGTFDNVTPYVYSYKNITGFSLEGKRNIKIDDEPEFKCKRFVIADDDGNEYQVPRDCGQWISGSYKYYDRVSHLGCIWLCIAPDGTTATPSDSASGVWLKEVSKGDKGDPGTQGPQGVAGTPGKDGVVYYTWIKYADTAIGGGISNQPDGKKYIGFAYNKTSQAESNNPADYTWSLIVGEKGDTGVPGAKGADGQTLSTWIKYSDNADGSGLYDTPTANTKYIGIATNKPIATESSVKTDYIWSKFKGDTGNYTVQLFKWAATEPAKPVGYSPVGWTTDSVKGAAITIAGGMVLTTSDGKMLLASYPDNYRLWGCQGVFDGATNTLIDHWGSVYPISGKDVDPEVLKAIQDAQDQQNDRLNSWAADSVISPTEKQALKDQWQAALTDKASIDADVARYSLTANVKYTAYVSAIGAAISAWSKYSAALPENIAIGADYDNIKAYYAARAAVQTVIAEEAAQTYANEAKRLAEITAAAYADGVVDAEEKRAIEDATAKANKAKEDAIAAANKADNEVVKDAAADATDKKYQAIEAFFGGAVDRATIESLMSGTAAPFEVKNGMVIMRDAFVKNLAAMNALIENLTARQIDTRAKNAQGNPTGRGVAISKSSSAVALYDEKGNLRATLDDGGRYEAGLNILSADGTENTLYSASMIQYMRNNMAGIFTLTPQNGMSYAMANGDGTYRTDFGFMKSGITLPSTATINMPCVALAGYEVQSDGAMPTIGRFGAKADMASGATTLGNGRYKIPHNIGHTNYNVHVTILGGDDDHMLACKEIRSLRTATAAVVRLSNLNGAPVGASFSITFFGKN